MFWLPNFNLGILSKPSFFSFLSISFLIDNSKTRSIKPLLKIVEGCKQISGQILEFSNVISVVLVPIALSSRSPKIMLLKV